MSWKVYRTICFECRGYCLPIKTRTDKPSLISCQLCGSEALAGVGTAFRPPAKNRVQAWKELKQLYLRKNKAKQAGIQKLLTSIDDQIASCQETSAKNKLVRQKEVALEQQSNSVTDIGFGCYRNHWQKKGKRTSKAIRERGFRASMR